MQLCEYDYFESFNDCSQRMKVPVLTLLIGVMLLIELFEPAYTKLVLLVQSWRLQIDFFAVGRDSWCFEPSSRG